MNHGTGSELRVRNEGKFIALVVCWLLGNGSLLSWNSMLTIKDYYVAIFLDYHPTRILTLVYQPFAFVTVVILTYYEARVNTRSRNLGGFSLFFISSALLIVLDVATSGKGGIGPFIGVCIISAAFGAADAHVQGGMVGDLSLMCPEFIQSFFAGFAASGAFTSALRFITKAAFDNSQDGLRKGANKTVRLWKVGCDDCLKAFVYNNYVTCVQFNPVDENYIFSGSIDGKIRIWEVQVRRIVDWTDLSALRTLSLHCVIILMGSSISPIPQWGARRSSRSMMTRSSGA